MLQINQAELYENEYVIINQFSQHKLGLKAGLSFAKIDNYGMACSPYRISMKNAVLVTAMSTQEISFFQKFKNEFCGLTLFFEPRSGANDFKIFARCIVRNIDKMKGKENIALISIDFKPCPPDLVNILADYFQLQSRLKIEYEDFRGKMISINPENASRLNYMNITQMVYDQKVSKVATFQIASNKLNFLVPMNGPILEKTKPVKMNLSFKDYNISILGDVDDVQKLPNGAQKASVNLKFSPELVSIMETYFYENAVVTRHC